MTSTDQIRVWYHSGVVLNHHQRNTPGYEPICNHNHPKVAFPNSSGGVYNEPVHPLTFEAWTAYVMVMNYHGETMPPSGGVNQCRNIFGTDWPSLHAYLCGCDLPPNSRKSAAFIGDMGKIRTNNGAFVFRNLPGDRMHDQINCSPTDLATGIDWTTVKGYIGDDMPSLPLRHGDGNDSGPRPERKEDVKRVEYGLNFLGYDVGTINGKYDDALAAAVVAFRQDHSSDWSGDGKTWTGFSDQLFIRELGAKAADSPALGELETEMVEVVKEVRIK